MIAGLVVYAVLAVAVLGALALAITVLASTDTRLEREHVRNERRICAVEHADRVIDRQIATRLHLRLVIAEPPGC